MRGRLVRGAVAVLAVLGGSIGAASAARERDSDRSVSGVRLAPAGAAEQRLCWANATRAHRPRARPTAGEGGGSAGRVGTSGGSAEEGWPTAAGVSGDGGAAGEGGETSDRGREGTGERGRLGASVAARRTVRGMVMVAVNVGSIAYGTPATGGAAGGGASGSLSKQPVTPNINRLLRQMSVKDGEGQLRVSLWVLSSTCLPRRDIPRAVKDFNEVGYQCEETHGVPGQRREETAGVMACWDPKRLVLLRVLRGGGAGQKKGGACGQGPVAAVCSHGRRGGGGWGAAGAGL